MVATPSMPPPTPFAVPESFPITWPSPEHAMLTFRQDRMHSPFPMTPMSGWWSQHFAVGMTEAFRVYSAPMRCDALWLNTYFYLGINPAVPPEEMARFEEDAPAVFQAAAARAWDRWQGEWLPELNAGWERWKSRDLPSLPDAELASAAREAVEWYERIWTIHFEMLLPAMLGASLFEELYTDLFPERDALSAYRLVQGFDSMSLEAGRELWLIARAAGEDEAVARLVRETPVDSLWDAIGTAPEAAELKERLDAYLSAYGLRSDNVQELATVSWIEDPTPPLANLKAYIDDPTDPRAVMAQQADEREQFLSETRAALAHHPEAARQGFEALLKIAQAFGRLQEDHNFWIDQRGTHEMRQLCLAIGHRLAARDVIERTADVFLLDLDEALEALQGGNAGAKDLVASRRAEMEHWAQVAPPPMI
ncbi:MAG TPA: hypothetical protein VLA89_09775, partial [Gemmatimonadales bacterium]|nr:hypothetical protein [Gemmatimonadales bacterium]